MAKIGCLDSVDDGILRGWALDQDGQSPARVDICVDGSVLDTIPCSEFRDDLLAAERGNGSHGFTYPLSPQYIRSRANITVKFTGTGPVLHNGERVLPDFTSRFLTSSALHSSALSKGLWCIDQLSFSQSEVTIAGWAIPARAASVPVAFTHNGNTLAELVRFPRNDLAVNLDLPRDEIGFGFQARGSLSPSERTHEFRFEHALAKRPFDANQSVHFICCETPIPPPDLRIRVHGSADPMTFTKEGSTAYIRLERFLQTYFAKRLQDFASILDWGCGSGRMLRYFPEQVLQNLTGIDIDQEAIEWCRQAFPHGQFLAVAMQPPTPLASETFDLIYANSVLTHLRENDHLQWLRELHRLAKPGAVLLLTTSGERNWWKGKFPSSRFVEWQVTRNGFYEGGHNTNLDAIGVGDYYRNVFVSADYIWRIWSGWFQIIDHVQGGFGDMQDMTVLRKPD
jgi:SAM-dependent methyltransferase